MAARGASQSSRGRGRGRGLGNVTNSKKNTVETAPTADAATKEKNTEAEPRSVRLKRTAHGNNNTASAPSSLRTRRTPAQVKLDEEKAASKAVELQKQRDAEEENIRRKIAALEDQLQKTDKAMDKHAARPDLQLAELRGLEAEVSLL